VIDGLKHVVLRLLKVPPEPHLPSGDPGTARVFRAGVNYWRLKLLGWTVQQAVTLIGFLMVVSVLHFTPETLELKRKGKDRPPIQIHLGSALVGMRILEVASWALWLAQIPFTFAVVRLDYEMRWYVVTDRAARLREGILSVKEMTFTLANVQDIRIAQGPLQRALGLADVELRTAGGSEPAPGPHGQQGGPNLHLARFRCVEADLADEIRDLVRERMKKTRGAGLGDPEDAHEAEPVVAPAVDAVAELRRESAALRQAVARLG